MKEFEKEIVTKQTVTVYEITKEELEKIKEEERYEGRQDVIEYIKFCAKYFTFNLNLPGIGKFVGCLGNFIHGRSNTIDNIYNYSFYDFIKEKR